ncbi:hypothetical protein [Methylobacterium sp. GC_Met_2]|uniref:hypothetical protein n=1 Tax=Methylobacterium sp. GC_Met_2 TaxID=2937376 RepID=UPI00226B7853|nr:hypothetical protein [Methylobacterium sp. GC_Met_2]
MKIAILVALLGVIVLLATILYMLFQPGAAHRAGPPSLGRMQAAVGRAVLEAAQSNPATAAMVRTAVQASPEEDRSLASELIATLPER